MKAHLEIGPEVADFLGPDALAQLREAISFPAYICAICDADGKLGDPGDPAAVIAWRYLPAGLTQVRYAHASCSPSTILKVNAYPESNSTFAFLSLWLTAIQPRRQGAITQHIPQPRRAA